MSQQLHFNLLTFEWPQKLTTFYFSIEKIKGSIPVHKSKYPSNIKDIFPNLENEETEEIHTTFEKQVEGSIPLEVDLIKKNNYLLKQYLNEKMYHYFKAMPNIIVTRNFINEPQIWIKNTIEHAKEYWTFNKFSLKIQFNKVSEFPELVIAYDDTSKMLKKSVIEISETVPLNYIRKIVMDKTVLDYQLIEPEELSSIDLNHCWPIANRELLSELGLSIDPKRTLNRYIKYKTEIDEFVKSYLNNAAFKNVIPLHSTEYLEVDKKRISNVSDSCNQLVFKNGNIGKVPKLDFPRYGAFVPSPHKNIQIFFIYHESHSELCKSLHKHLSKGTGKYYKGLYNFSSIPYHQNLDLAIKYKNEENPLEEIIDKLNGLTFDPGTTYVAFYLSPINKHAEDKTKRKVYYRVKEELLKRRIVSQVIDSEKLAVKIDDYQFELNNISLALLAKLQGKPWQLNTPPNRELIIGIGAFKNIDENIQYVASACSFNNNGSFKRFDYFSKSDTTLLAGSICNAIDEYAKLENNPSKVVIHFYKKMSVEELKPIIQKMNSLKLDCPLYIVNINKTDSKDLIAFDMNWKGQLMPRSGTFIKIGWNQFLLFNNTRYSDDNKFSSLDGYHFPLKLTITSPNNEDELDHHEIQKLIEQVYQFSRLYWKSLRQQNVPITILYPEMVAEIAPNFESGTIPAHGKDILWFL
jgi:hypothetical protein